MKTIVLFVRNPVLKMSVIRVLLKNNLYYLEASNIEELIVKLDLAQNIGLLIQDFMEEEEETGILETISRANLQQLPLLWIVPSEQRHQLPDCMQQYVADILLSPFQPSTLLRKIEGILHTEGNKARVRKKMSNVLKLSLEHSNLIMNAIKSATMGSYPICMIRLQVTDAFLELNLHLLDELKQILRQTDQVLETGLGEFIILCPYTPLEGLYIVENKMKEAVESIIRDVGSVHEVHLFGTVYPDDAKDYKELVSKLANK